MKYVLLLIASLALAGDAFAQGIGMGKGIMDVRNNTVGPPPLLTGGTNILTGGTNLLLR